MTILQTSAFWAAALVVLGGLGSARADAPTLKDIGVVQRPVTVIAPPAPTDFSVTAWVDQDDLTYAPGENLTVFARASADAYLTILDIGTSGAVHIIFPNAYQQDNFVKAGQTVAIPGRNARFDFKVGGPEGTEVLKVIATSKPGPVLRETPMAEVGPFARVVGDGETIAKDIRVTLRETQENLFAEYHKIIRIAAPQPVRVGMNVTPPPAPSALPVGGEISAAPAVVAAAPVALPDGFDLEISAPRAVYRPGEPIALDVYAERACNLTLINLGSSGASRILFPNGYAPTARIQGGVVTRIEGPSPAESYIVTGPAGIDTVVGVCLEDGLTPLTVAPDFSREPYPSVGDKATVSKDIAVTLARADVAIGYDAFALMVRP